MKLNLLNDIPTLLSLPLTREKVWTVFDRLQWDLANPNSCPSQEVSYGEWLEILNTRLPVRANDKLFLVSSNGNYGLCVNIPPTCQTVFRLLCFIDDSYGLPINRNTCGPEVVKWIENELYDRWKDPQDLLHDLHQEKLTVRDLLGDHSYFEGLSRIGESNVLNIRFGS